jgi:ProP effector
MSDLPEVPPSTDAMAQPVLPTPVVDAAVPHTPHTPLTPATTEPTPEPTPEPTTEPTLEPTPEAKGPPNLSPAACAALLAQRFPALFGAGRALPIKLRIQADIQTRAPGLFNKKSLSIFLHRYTTSTAYLKALATGTARADLDGAPAGDVAEEHRTAAAAEVERRRNMFEERRAAERDLQREARQAEAEQRRRQQAAEQAARHAAQNSAEAQARRQRAAMLHAFETTTLTPANFCALKGLVEADLQAQLALARQEREQRPVPNDPSAGRGPAGHGQRHDGRNDGRNDNRKDGRVEREGRRAAGPNDQHDPRQAPRPNRPGRNARPPKAGPN